jgi:hypothetical protein
MLVIMALVQIVRQERPDLVNALVGQAADVVKLAYKGEWLKLLRHLESQRHLVNSNSAKGYTLCTKRHGTAQSLA